MNKIDKKIVKTSVKNSENSLEKISQTSGKNFEKLEREEVLSGHCYKLKTTVAEHSFYITINNQKHDDTVKAFEVFIQSKNIEWFQFERIVSLTLSAFLRTGADIQFLLAEYKEIQDPKGGFFFKYKFLGEKSIFYPSLISLIAHVLEKHMEKL